MLIEKVIISIFIFGIILTPIFASLGIPIYWPSLLLVILLVLFKHIELLFKPIIFVSLLYCLLLFIYDIDLIYSDLKLPLGNLNFFIPFFMVGIIQELINKDKSSTLIKFVGKVSFYSISLLSILTIISLIKDPLAVRSVFRTEKVLLTHSFVGIYFLSIIVVIPFLSNISKTPLFHKVLIFINIVTLLMAGLSTAIFILALSFGLVITLKYRKKAVFIKTTVLFLFLYLAFSYQFLIDNLIKLLPTGLQESKQNEIRNINFDSVDFFFETYRYGKFFDSWHSFTLNPIFGNQELVFGQHSSVIDKLGLFGLFGTTIFFFLYYLLYKNAVKFFDSAIAKKYITSASLIIFISMILNPLDIYHTQFFYLFCLIFPCTVNYLLTLKGVYK